LIQTIKYTDKNYLMCLLLKSALHHMLSFNKQYKHRLKIKLYINITLNYFEPI